MLSAALSCIIVIIKIDQLNNTFSFSCIRRAPMSSYRSGDSGSQQRDVADGADVVFTDTHWPMDRTTGQMEWRDGSSAHARMCMASGPSLSLSSRRH